MSYEGRIQILCKNGHYFECADTSSPWEDNPLSQWTCPARVENAICRQPIGETNGINDTNGEAYGERGLVPIAPEIKTTCNLGHDHVWTAARFRFSEQRYYYDVETNRKLSIPAPEFGS